MGRKKISMNFIEDDRKRASTFDKRRIGLFKKASELNRLCGVSISVIIVNKDLVYKFSDPPHSFYKKINNKPEKIEEDFNNDTLLDFINKKAQKNAYINDSNSIEHHSLEEEQNGTLTDDEEDQRFLDVLDEHHLRDVYNNIDPDISPIKENVDILQIKNLNESDQMNAPGGLMAYNFASNNQNIAQIIAPNNSINEMPMEFPSKGHEEMITSTKMENVYSELVTVSTTDTSYLYDNTSYSLSNSNWQTYKSHNYSNTNLNFNNANYQNATNYLETPTFETCSNGIILHLPNILHEEDDRPNLKRIKRFNDSIDT